MLEIRKTAKEISRHLATGKFIGNENVSITNIQFDSHYVVKNSIFCALQGIHRDGHDFIPQALQQGATCILCSQNYTFTQSQLKNIGVYQTHPQQIRRTMAEISEILYDFPGDQLKLIGVTGTDGKSTTVYFIHQILNHIGIKSGYLSTVDFFDGEKKSNNTLRQSTPESPQIQEILYKMHTNKCSVAILETTSHGLSEQTARTHGLEFDIGILTNIGSEHLEFHKTVKQYAYDKSRLFSKIKSQGLGIIRKEEPYFELFQNSLRTSGAQSCTYSIKKPTASYFAKDIQYEQRHIEGTIIFKGDRIRLSEQSVLYLNCIGAYNVENILAALAAVHQLRIPLQDIVMQIPKLKLPKGRMQIVRNDLPILPIIDYAHTPVSFDSILPLMKSMTKNRLIVVFGSAGERDKVKRTKQGSIADKYANIIVLADEDPRGEDPLSIIQEIGGGCTKHVLDKDLFYIPHRQEAIHKALSLALPGDIVLFLGKGHEQSIEYNTTSMEWDEATEVNKALESLIGIANW